MIVHERWTLACLKVEIEDGEHNCVSNLKVLKIFATQDAVFFGMELFETENTAADNVAGIPDAPVGRMTRSHNIPVYDSAKSPI